MKTQYPSSELFDSCVLRGCHYFQVLAPKKLRVWRRVCHILEKVKHIITLARMAAINVRNLSSAVHKLYCLCLCKYVWLMDFPKMFPYSNIQICRDLPYQSKICVQVCIQKFSQNNFHDILRLLYTYVTLFPLWQITKGLNFFSRKLWS